MNYKNDEMIKISKHSMNEIATVAINAQVTA